MLFCDTKRILFERIRSLVGSLTHNKLDLFRCHTVQFRSVIVRRGRRCRRRCREEDAILSLHNSLPVCDRCSGSGNADGWDHEWDKKFHAVFAVFVRSRDTTSIGARHTM